VHSPKGVISFAPQLNYLTKIVLELKAKLVKIKVETKEIKNQLAVTHLSLINKVRHRGKSDLSLSTLFQHKYHFQNPKIKNLFLDQELKIQKSSGKELEKEDGL